MEQVLEYSFARVMTRLFGVVLFVWGVTALARTLIWLVTMAVMSQGPAEMILMNAVLEVLPSAVVIAMGVYFARDGHLLARILVAGMHGRCRRCGYDIRAVTTGVCPECGTPLPAPSTPSRTPADEVHP